MTPAVPGTGAPAVTLACMPDTYKQRAPLVHLRNSIDSMSETLARVGQYVLANPEKVVRQSVSELAEFARSGQASVVRFCRQLGFEGFSDFKLALMAELASSDRPASSERDEEERLRTLVQALTLSMENTAFALDRDRLAAVAECLMGARRIDIFGSGISGIVAQLVAYRLMRLGLPAQAFQDPVLAHEVMTGVDKSCVALAVSESGITLDTVEFLRRARSAGAVTIAVTGRVNSPVAHEADLVLLAVPVVPLTVGGDISSAVAKIFLAEALARAIAHFQHGIDEA